jgi:hypothetical protein
MILGWASILLLAVILFRLAGHVDKKVRGLSGRPRRREDQVA